MAGNSMIFFFEHLLSRCQVSPFHGRLVAATFMIEECASIR